MIRRAGTAADLDAYARVWSEVHPELPTSGRGIAGAWKQTQIAWAAGRGYRRPITDTHWANEATRRLNESLGYRPLPPLVWVRRELS